MKDLIEQALDYLNHGIWRIKIRDLPLRKYFLLRSLRIIVLSFRGFVEDKCTLRASALTFFSLLSVVPVVAVCWQEVKIPANIQKINRKRRAFIYFLL